MSVQQRLKIVARRFSGIFSAVRRDVQSAVTKQDELKVRHLRAMDIECLHDRSLPPEASEWPSAMTTPRYRWLSLSVGVDFEERVDAVEKLRLDFISCAVHHMQRHAADRAIGQENGHARVGELARRAFIQS